MSDFLPTAPLSNLRHRAEWLRQLRGFFHEQEFWEVETPLLSADTVIDRHLDPIPVACPTGSDPRETYWLQTSPEFAMKRLLAAGADAIFQVTRAFRRDEFGTLHNPEFTIVEWYRVGDDLAAGMQRLSDLADMILGHGTTECGNTELCSYHAAFDAHLGIDPHRASVETLRATARRVGVDIPNSMTSDAIPWDRDAWLQLLMAEVIQPRLGTDRPLILFDYPASQAALAQVRGGPSPVAERFELFFKGVELANGYHELTDANVLVARQRQENECRRRDGKPRLPEPNRLIEAMRAGLPACAGVALGFDRLVMVALGARSLAEVMAFPFSRA